jgi:hypothetical protein
MVKPDIVVKLPAFSKNAKENKIEIHKNFTTEEQLKTKIAKKGAKKGLRKTVRITTKSKKGAKPRRGKNGKRGGSLSSVASTLFNYTRRAKETVVNSANDSYTYIFDKVSVVKGNVSKMVDGVKIYKNDEHVKDVVLENNYISNLFASAKQRFSRKISDTNDKLKSTKMKLIDHMRNATFIVKEDSTFYKYLDLATKHVKDHKRVYAVLAFIIISAFVLFVPFTGIMLFTLVPFAFSYLATAAPVVFYSATGAINAGVIAPAAAGFAATVPGLAGTAGQAIVTGATVSGQAIATGATVGAQAIATGAQPAVAELANIATGATTASFTVTV